MDDPGSPVYDSNKGSINDPALEEKVDDPRSPVNVSCFKVDFCRFVYVAKSRKLSCSGKLICQLKRESDIYHEMPGMTKPLLSE